MTQQGLTKEPAIGVIGGSGFYNWDLLQDAKRFEINTPFGKPSSPLIEGRMHGRRVIFLARHGERHSQLPSEVNARANIYALKTLGVSKLISVSAVGSLREDIHPGQVVLPRQLIDQTRMRPASFFGQGVIAHVSLADPICNGLADQLVSACDQTNSKVHATGTYLCIEGPQFSTRAESMLWQKLGADVVGMTNLPEARLAREAEICYATLVIPTDYDAWRPKDEVRVADVLGVLLANVDKAKRIVSAALKNLDAAAACSCHTVLDTALLTPPEQVSQEAAERLHALLARRLRMGADAKQRS